VLLEAVKFDVWGLSGTLVTEHDADLEFATTRLWHWLDQIDAACNRFRADSEISKINNSDGATMRVSDVFAQCLNAALQSAVWTDGLCDPTVLNALLAVGYDRDYAQVLRGPEVVPSPTIPTPGIDAIHFDPSTNELTLSAPCRLDLGASAKALACDLVVNDVMERVGVLVEIGGDVALRGAGKDGPWVVGVADTNQITGSEPRVAPAPGGVATSSTQLRTWPSATGICNHIIDPRTGTCATGPYTHATVSAPSCVMANAFATAALLWGEDAGFHLAQSGLNARLVRHDRTVEFIGGWPEDSSDAC
jgi:thiamine biosynthesis lipoprotein